MCDHCKDDESTTLQRKATRATGPALAPPLVHDVVRSASQSLDGQTLALFANRFGRDFSHVRVHTDSRAAQSAVAVNALAYTHRNHIAFGAGQYAPTTSSGRALLGHELAHTIQQSGPRASSGAAIEIGAPDSDLEREAESASETVHSGRSVVAGSVSRFILQRQAPGPVPVGARASAPEDFGIAVVVVDHGASGARAAAEARLRQVFYSLSSDNLAQMQSDGITGVEMHIIPYDKKIIELTEYARLKGTRTHDGRLWDDVRGAGGRRDGSTILYAVAEEDLPGGRHSHGAAIGLGIAGGLLGGAGGAALGVILGQNAQGGTSGPGGIIGGIVGGVLGAGLLATGGALLGNLADKSSNYGPGFLATHEGTHNVEDFALTPDQRTRLAELYEARKTAGGPWLEPADYTKSTIHEYFAQCASAFFSTPYSSQYASSYTPDWLRTNDRGMYDLLSEVFGSRQPGIRNDMLDRRYRPTGAAAAA
jgi:hypothetical protein